MFFFLSSLTEFSDPVAFAELKECYSQSESASETPPLIVVGGQNETTVIGDETTVYKVIDQNIMETSTQ